LFFTPSDPLSQVLDSKLLPDFGGVMDGDFESVVGDNNTHTIEVERATVVVFVFLVVQVIFIAHHHPFLGFTLSNLITIPYAE